MLVSQPEGLPRLICKPKHTVGEERVSTRVEGAYFSKTVLRELALKMIWVWFSVCLFFAIHNILMSMND